MRERSSFMRCERWASQPSLSARTASRVATTRASERAASARPPSS